MKAKYSFEQTKDSAKAVDAWWTVAIIDPIAFRVTWFIANFTSLTPNQISFLALLIGIAASYFYFQGDYQSLVIAAFIFESAFILDCVDGKLARLKKTGTKFGAYWDFLQDRIIQFIALFALIWGQYQVKGDINFIWLGLVYLFADSLHRVMAFHISKVRFQYGGRFFVRQTRDDLEDELTEYKKTDSGFKVSVKQWLWTRRLAILPTTIEIRVLIFLFAAVFNQIFVGLVLAIIILLSLVVLRSILTIKRLNSM